MVAGIVLRESSQKRRNVPHREQAAYLRGPLNIHTTIMTIRIGQI